MGSKAQSDFFSGDRTGRRVSHEHGVPLGPLGNAVIAAGGQTRSVLPVVGTVQGRPGAWLPVVRSKQPSSRWWHPPVRWQVIALVVAMGLVLASIIEHGSEPVRSAGNRHAAHDPAVDQVVHDTPAARVTEASRIPRRRRAAATSILHDRRHRSTRMRSQPRISPINQHRSSAPRISTPVAAAAGAPRVTPATNQSAAQPAIRTQSNAIELVPVH